jgi:hypothetical protein
MRATVHRVVGIGVIAAVGLGGKTLGEGGEDGGQA